MSGPRRAQVVLVVLSANVALLASACTREGEREASDAWSDRERVVILSLSPVTPCPPAPHNRLADDDDAAALGHALFFDARLSGNGAVSCATCHDPARYFTDGRTTAVGIGPAPRHAGSVLGAAWSPFLTWDGRKDSLWSQALQPIEDGNEMGSHRLLVARLLRDQYRDQVERVLGPIAPDLDAYFAAQPVPASAAQAAEAWTELPATVRDAVDAMFVGAAKAIAAYERRLTPGAAPFDAYVAALRAGDPRGGGHLPPAAVRGLRAFLGDAGCIHCHNGPLFTDFAFHNLGLPEPPDRVAPDPGRADGVRRLLADPFRSDAAFSDAASNPELTYLNRDFADALGAFRTPSLRNVARTAPYGHAGQFETLEAVLDFYVERGEPAIGHLDPLLEQVGRFSVPDMTAFLESLTGPVPPPPWGAAPFAARSAAPVAAPPAAQGP